MDAQGLVAVEKIDGSKARDLVEMDNMFEVPAHHQIYFRHACGCNMFRVVLGGSPQDSGLQIGVSKLSQIRRAVDEFKVMGYLVHSSDACMLWWVLLIPAA